ERRGRVDLVTDALGDRVRRWNLDEVPDLVVLSRLAGEHADVAGRWLAEGVPVISTSDDPDEIATLLDLAPVARHHDTVLVVGVAMSPGISCVLARHAASALDEVAELHVAMVGAAGPGCVRHRQRLATEQ